MASAAHQGVQVMAGVSVRTVSRQKSRWHIALSNAATFRAHWLVDPSGHSGVVVRQLGITRRRLDQQIAQIALLTPSEPADDYWGTSVEAVAEGWWYTTPLPDGQRVLAYLTDRDCLAGKADRQRAWRDRLAETLHMQHLAGRAAHSAPIKTFPADASHRARLYGDGWIVVGDAAITLDPHSSQGIVTGVLMGARAGPAIALGEGQTSLLQAWDRDYRQLWAEHQSLGACRTFVSHLVK
jgi:flavin-dependent dehydrogenase